MKRILEGIRVLDFTTTIAGALAGAMMADHGATVIKIEDPETGDPCRRLPPIKEGVSLMHCWVNRGKRSVAVSLDDAEGAGLIRRMMKEADVVIESYLPGYMKERGLAYDDTDTSCPGLIYCSVTPFGQTGPYHQKPATELIMQAMSGAMSVTGYADGPPMCHGITLAESAGAQNAYAAIMTALCSRQDTGQGQYIDVPVTQAVMWMNSAFDRTNIQVYATREGNHHASLSPYGLFAGANGQSAVICALNPKIWTSICEMIGRPELADAPEFNTVYQRVANRYKVVDVIEEWLQNFDDIREAILLMEQRGIPCCQVASTQDVLSDRHIRHCGWLIDAPAPDSLRAKGIETYLAVNGCAVFSETPHIIGKAPDLGQDNGLLAAFVKEEERCYA